MKCKKLEAFMLLYQYLYYVMRGWDKQLRLPPWITQSKALVAYGALEGFVFIAIYIAFAHIISGHKTIVRDFNLFTIDVGLIGSGAILYLFNLKLLGSDLRLEYYNKIFNSWDKSKRLRWRFYVFTIMISIAALFMVIIEVDQYGLNPKNWGFN